MIDLPVFTSPFGKDFGFSVRTMDEYDTSALYPEEIEIVSPKAVEKRKKEFCLGRSAAHAALSKLHYKDFPVLKGKNNEPIWPANVVGAISHAGDIAMAAVALKTCTAGIGIDVENISEKVSIDIAKKICTEDEFRWVSEREMDTRTRMFMIFSAKESVFKAFFPIERVFLDFSDAELLWDRVGEKFQGRLLRSAGNDYPAGYRFSVHAQIKGEYVFTSMFLPPCFK